MSLGYLGEVIRPLIAENDYTLAFPFYCFTIDSALVGAPALPDFLFSLQCYLFGCLALSINQNRAKTLTVHDRKS